MNWLKHILLMVALLASTLPCVHADDHFEHSHDAYAKEQLCASHACACHSCDEAACTEDLDVEQQTVSISITVARPATDIILFTHTELRPVVRRITTPVNNALSALKTVQLLT